MSLQVRQLDRENTNVRPAKAVLQPTINTRRLALGEVGNKIHLNTKQNGTKPKETKSSADVKKKLAAIPVKKTTTETTVTDKVDKGATKFRIKEPSEEIDHAVVNPVKRCPSTKESYSTKQLIEIINIDTSDNPLHVSEYIQDIYKYLLEVEDKYCIDTNFLEGHKSTSRMRAVLVNWMVEIHINFKLLLETLHLSVAIVDRYLQLNKEIDRSTLQLVGTVAMLIASKYEEMYFPKLSDFVYICDDTFSANQLLQMERDILKRLEFNLGRPLSIQFLRRFNRIAIAQSQHHTLGKYILELALIDYEFCQVKPSIQAAATCCFAISILDNIEPSKAWTKLLVHYSSYTYSVIKPVLVIIACVLNRAETSKHQCIRTKYASTNYQKVSLNPKLKGPLVKKLIGQAAIISKK